MKSPDIKPYLETERNQTDVSLTTERGKTDESLFDLRKKAELETDERVKIDRDEADQARAQSRTDTDSDQAADNKMFEQRQFDDSTVQAERSSMDAAIKHERKQKEAVLSRFLHREREDTDGNLLRERQQTDSQHVRSIKQLTDETSLHLLTKEALTTRDQFLAIVSHDLRNPIGAVLSCADMLLDDVSSLGSDQESRYWIQFIKRNAETSLRLISDILDMERFAQGKLELMPEKQNIQDLVKETAEEFIHVAATKGILLKVMPAEKAMEVVCDRDRVSQVLANLISNSLKFTPELGSVSVSIKQCDSQVEVSVIDTGSGVAEDKKDGIFERFAQINNKDRRGLGLGLHISKTLVEAHGGNLWLESKLGQGSTFTFSLPISGPPLTAAATATAPATSAVSK